MDELGVKSVIGRDEELESLSSEFTRVGQQRPEMRLGRSECKMSSDGADVAQSRWRR